MKRTLERSGRLAVVATLATLVPSPSFAATYTWTTGGNNWFSAGETLSAAWQPTGGSLSGGGQSVAFQGTGSGTLNGSTTVVDLTFNAGNSTDIAGVNTLGVTGNITSNQAGTATIGGASGTLNLSGATTTIDTGANGITIDRILAGGASVTKIGTGTLTIRNASAYNNLLTVSSGSLVLQSTAISFGGSVKSNSVGGVLILTSVSGSVNLTAGSNNILQSNNSIASLTTTGGTLIANSGTVLGTTSIKDTSVSSASTFTGVLTIDGGAQTQDMSGSRVKSDLVVKSGSVLFNYYSPTTVGGSLDQSGGRLEGISAVTGTTTTTGGTSVFGNRTSSFTSGSAVNLGGTTFLDVGENGVASVNHGGLTLKGGSDLHLQFTNAAGNNQSWDVGGGVLNYGGTLSLDLTTGVTSTNGASWQFFENFSTTTGSFSAVQINTLVGGAYANLNADPFFLATNATNKYDYRYGDGVWLSNWTSGQRFIFDQKTGVLTVVPEPSTFVFAGIGAAMLAWQTWCGGRRSKARIKLSKEQTQKLGEHRGLG